MVEIDFYSISINYQVGSGPSGENSSLSSKKFQIQPDMDPDRYGMPTYIYPDSARSGGTPTVDIYTVRGPGSSLELADNTLGPKHSDEI